MANATVVKLAVVLVYSVWRTVVHCQRPETTHE